MGLPVIRFGGTGFIWIFIWITFTDLNREKLQHLPNGRGAPEPKVIAQQVNRCVVERRRRGTIE